MERNMSSYRASCGGAAGMGPAEAGGVGDMPVRFHAVGGFPPVPLARPPRGWPKLFVWAGPMAEKRYLEYSLQ